MDFIELEIDLVQSRPIVISCANAKGWLRMQLSWISVISSSITVSLIHNSRISCDIAFSVAPAWDKDDARVGVDLIKELRRSNMADGRQSPRQECSKFKRWGGLWDEKLIYVFV
ncbi:hypothetical protein Tco_0202239 [Tanacetum coccineum]